MADVETVVDGSKAREKEVLSFRSYRRGGMGGRGVTGHVPPTASHTTDGPPPPWESEFAGYQYRCYKMSRPSAQSQVVGRRLLVRTQLAKPSRTLSGKRSFSGRSVKTGLGGLRRAQVPR